MEPRVLLTTFYAVAGSGNGGKGTLTNPWTSLASVGSGQTLKTYDVVTFTGTFRNQTLTLGAWASGVTFTSSATSPATIAESPSWGSTSAIEVDHASGVTISNLVLRGPGITANTTNYYGIWFNDSSGSGSYSNETIDNVKESGFAYAGLEMKGNQTSGFSNVVIRNSSFSDNQVSGIVVEGTNKAYPTTYAINNLTISNCITSGNAGADVHDHYAANAANGGIFLDSVNTALVTHCTAIGNCYNSTAAIGIWAYNSTLVDFEYDEAGETKTQVLGMDGGGFDFEHGTTNSIMQYCYSHGNMGEGFVIDSFSGTSDNSNDTIRYCVADDNLWGILLYGYQNPTTLQCYNVTNANIYNNTVTGGENTIALLINGTTAQSGQSITAHITNNIFYMDAASGVQAIFQYGNQPGFVPSLSNIQFEGNDYYMTGGASPVFEWGSAQPYPSTLAAFRQVSGEETVNGSPVGSNVDPQFAGGTIGGDLPITSAGAFALLPGSPLHAAGQDMSVAPFANYGQNWGGIGMQDFYGNPLVVGVSRDIGADQAVQVPGSINIKSAGGGRSTVIVNSSTTDTVEFWLPIADPVQLWNGPEAVTIDDSAGNAVGSAGIGFTENPAYANASTLLMIGTGGNDSFSSYNSVLFSGSIPVGFTGIAHVYLNPNGGTDSLGVASGTLVLSAGAVGGGYVQRNFSALSIAPGAELFVQPSTVYHTDRQVLVAPASVNLSGMLDLTSNDMIIQNGNLPGTNGNVATGHNLFSSVTTLPTSAGVANTSLGVMTDGAISFYPSFDGVAVTKTSVLIKWTFVGDANLDGRVDAYDSPFQTRGTTGWFNGDFNYDGVVNAVDQALFNWDQRNQGGTYLSP